MQGAGGLLGRARHAVEVAQGGLHDTVDRLKAALPHPQAHPSPAPADASPQVDKAPGHGRANLEGVVEKTRTVLHKTGEQIGHVATATAQATAHGAATVRDTAVTGVEKGRDIVNKVQGALPGVAGWRGAHAWPLLGRGPE